MPYKMVFNTDGSCPGNQHGPRAVGGIGVALVRRYGKTLGWSRAASWYAYGHPVTNQRAELGALVYALEIAIERREKLHSSPKLIVRIRSDSKYAVDCMTKWIQKWRENGWITSAGHTVKNSDLIQRIDELWDEIMAGDGGGRVSFTWIPREQNKFADGLARQGCSL